MIQNLIVSSWEELKLQFASNKLKSNRKIKVGLLFNAYLKKNEFLDKLKEFNFNPKELDGIIRVNFLLDGNTPEENKPLKSLESFLYSSNYQNSNFKKINEIESRRKREKQVEDFNFELKTKHFILYLHFISENHILFISTNDTKHIESKFLTNFVDKIQGVSNLWLSYQLMENLYLNLKNKTEEFTFKKIEAVYRRTFKKKAEIRPEFNKKSIFMDEDAENQFEELRTPYGLHPQKIDLVHPAYGGFTISKTSITFKFSTIDPKFLIEEIIPWIYTQAEIYLSKILNFKIKEIIDPITQISHYLSNFLIFNYKSEKNININEIIAEINSQPEIKVISQFQDNEDEFDLVLGEPISTSIVNAYITPQRLHFTITHGDAFNSMVPLLNILDNYGELVLVNQN